MKKLPAKQKGASPIVTIIVLALLGCGVYVGIQYAPIAIEDRSIRSILTTLETTNKSDPVSSPQELKSKIIKALQINEMNDMTDTFTVKKIKGKIVVTFNYDRELNLIYETKTIHFEQTLSL
jgi:hypothetical protein